MSSPHDRERCLATGKVCFTRAEAKRAAASLGRVRIGHISTYKCPDAESHPWGMFHIGHTPSPRRARRRGKGKKRNR